MVGKCVRVGVLDGEETTEPERGPSLPLPKDPRAFAFLPSTSMAAVYRREDQELPSMRYVRVPDITRSSPRGQGSPRKHTKPGRCVRIAVQQLHRCPDTSIVVARSSTATAWRLDTVG